MLPDHPSKEVWIVVDPRYPLQELRQGSFRRLPRHRPRRRGDRHGIAGLGNGPAAVSRYHDQSFSLQSFGECAACARREFGAFSRASTPHSQSRVQAAVATSGQRQDRLGALNTKGGWHKGGG